MDPTQAFIEMIQGPAHEIELARGALLLSAHSRTDLDLDDALVRMQGLADGCPEPTLDGLLRHLFGDLGFGGAVKDYYAPENSFLDAVLDRRRGLPITLAVLCLDVGGRLGVPLDGIGMPGHFLLRDRVLRDLFVDPFAGGVILDRAGCERRFRSIAGDRAPFLDRYLEPVDSAGILGRMAANLVSAYWRREDRQGLRWAATVRAACPGVGPGEQVQLGMALAHAGAFDLAADLYDAASAATPEGRDDATTWQGEARRLRARLN